MSVNRLPLPSPPKKKIIKKKGKEEGLAIWDWKLLNLLESIFRNIRKQNGTMRDALWLATVCVWAPLIGYSMCVGSTDWLQYVCYTTDVINNVGPCVAQAGF